ncbi:oligosaccharide flippase family protein, partial [Paraprevotella clara]
MSSGIKRNFFFSSILTTANYVFPLLTYPYVSRVLGANGIGICNFVDSIVTYFLMFSMMGITILGIRETAINKKQTEKLSEVFSNLFVLNTIFTIIVFIAYVLFCVFVSEMQEYKSLAILGGFKIIFNYLLIEWFYKGLEEFRYITLRTLCVKCLYVFSVFLFVRDKEDYGIYYALSVFMIVFNAVINVKHCGK